MIEGYDVLVAGGGPSGLQFAREVARESDQAVAVLEADDDVTDNDKSSAATFHQVVEGYDLRESVVMSNTVDVLFEGPSEESRVPTPGYILDFPELQAFLSERARSHGADVYTGVKVLEPVLEDGSVVGVEYLEGSERATASADLVVAATGPAANLTRRLDMFDPDSAQRGIGKEYVVVGDYDVESMLIRFDHEVAPGGYAWTFPAGERTYKAGICWVDDFYEKRAAGNGRIIDDYVEAWIDGDSRWERDEVRAAHAGEVVSNNSINTRAVDGLVAIGDAVSSVNPLFGEGIRPAMESASMAAEVAVPAVEDGDTSRERLVEYGRRWNREKGRDWKLQRMVGELLYDFDPGRQDRFVRKAGNLTAGQVDRLQRYDLRIRDLLALYPFDLGDVRELPALIRHL